MPWLPQLPGPCLALALSGTLSAEASAADLVTGPGTDEPATPPFMPSPPMGGSQRRDPAAADVLFVLLENRGCAVWRVPVHAYRVFLCMCVACSCAHACFVVYEMCAPAHVLGIDACGCLCCACIRVTCVHVCCLCSVLSAHVR